MGIIYSSLIAFKDNIFFQNPVSLQPIAQIWQKIS
jgi:hypothetical protein